MNIEQSCSLLDLRKELCAQALVALLQKPSKLFCLIHFGLMQHISGLKMCHISFWFIKGCCWDPQINSSQIKKLGSLNLITDYVLYQACQLFREFSIRFRCVLVSLKESLLLAYKLPYRDLQNKTPVLLT